MERELKIGDKVRIAKPKVTKVTCWIEVMERFIGKVSEIEFISSDKSSAKLKNIGYIFPLTSLTLVEEETEQVTEQPTEQVTKQIDWEQRRWELASKFYLDPNVSTPESATRQADTFIDYYKQTLK